MNTGNIIVDKELTYPETAPKSEKEIAITFKSDTPNFQKGEPPLSEVTRNTKITTKNIKVSKKEKVCKNG